MLDVLGVYKLEGTDEPVHLIEVAISGSFGDVDWGSITQPNSEQPSSNWQVPYDERSVGNLPDGRTRGVFFFHYLELDQPLQSAYGSLPLPAAKARPAHLDGIDYEQP